MSPVVELARRSPAEQAWLATGMDHLPTGTEPTVVVGADGGAVAETTAAGWSVHPVTGRDRSGESGARAAGELAAALLADLNPAGEIGGGTEREIHVWLDLPPVAAEHLVELLDALGARRDRTLLQLRVPLPLDAAPTLQVRPMTEDDFEEVVRVNNAAFAWHPEQGHMTVDDLRARTAHDWFSPEDLLIHEIDGIVAGFCWIRLHPATGLDPPLGEIHVIAVDPDHHGRGLGRGLTVAGMAHVHERHLTTGMLWVEGDNEPALGLYRSLGFAEARRRTAAIITRR